MLARTTLYATLAFMPAMAEARNVVEFVACPVYRDIDAGPKTGCWLAEDRKSGIRYDITLSPTKPDMNHAVLVEGIVAEGAADVCGGTVLKPVRISRLVEGCPAYLIPAEGRKGHGWFLPETHLPHLDVKRDPVPPPHSNKEFTIYFDLNKDFLLYQLDDHWLDKAAHYVQSAKPKKVRITGFAQVKPYEVDGHSFSEPAELAEQRARIVALALFRLGVPKELLDIKWSTAPGHRPELTDGLPHAAMRRVTINVEM